jgi:hypothetical protein
VVAEVVVWHGTPEGVFELSLAVIHNCDCRPPAACAAHRAMLEQRFLDGVLFVRYLRVRLLVEEFKA